MHQLQELPGRTWFQWDLSCVAAHSSCLALAFLQVRALDAPAVRQPVSTNAYWVVLDQLSHESEELRRSSTPGSFLGKRSPHPQQFRLIGEGGGRLASSRPAALSVSEGAIGIPLLFLCPCDTSKWALLRMAISVCLASIRTSPCKGGGNVS